MVLDLGSGAYGPLSRLVSPDRIDAVVLSHLHADHCVDLAALAVAAKHGPYHLSRPIPVFGPAGVGERIAAIYGSSQAELAGVFRFGELADQPVPLQIGPFVARFARVVHPVPAFGIRLEAGGAALTYSGDTGPTPALTALAAECDLALFEASFPSSQPGPANLHLTGLQAAEHATAAGARRLVLTHLVPWVDHASLQSEARTGFTGPVELARPGLAISITAA